MGVQAIQSENSGYTRSKYYRPSVISVTVTKGGYLRYNRLYKTSKTIKQGVAESYS